MLRSSFGRLALVGMALAGAALHGAANALPPAAVVHAREVAPVRRGTGTAYTPHRHGAGSTGTHKQVRRRLLKAGRRRH